MRIRSWLVVVAGLLGCGSGTDVPLGDRIDGAVAADAPAVDASAASFDASALDSGPTADAAPATDAPSCGCGPASCEERACGRSACGYPCGTCSGAEWCNRGTCRAFEAPGTPCGDAFHWPGWPAVWEGDVGLRVCPGDPGQVEACQCTGGGPDSWVGCSGSCFAPCGGAVQCGDTTCGPLEYCQVCPAGDSPPTSACRPRSESPGCPLGSFELFVLCDGDEDCAATDKCMAVVGDTVVLSCQRDDTVSACGAGGVYHDLCATLDDCPACATSCSPLPFADWVTPTGRAERVCQ